MQVIIANQNVHIPLIDVIIGADDDNPDNLNAFFCPYDRNPQPLLQFKGKIISITPGGAPVGLPVIKRCANCKRNYSFLMNI